MNKIIKNTAIIIAVVIAILYTFNYDYLFKAIAKTYFRGETGATIVDAELFENNPIATSYPKSWQKDPLYNTVSLSKSLKDELTNTQTAAFLVIKNGNLLHEQYWDGFQAMSPTNSFSMAKGITVMLLGTAIEDKLVSGINQKYSEFYENYANVKFGNSLTLENLATMEAGLDWNENYKNPFSPNASAYYGNNLGKTTFLRGFTEKPGTKFYYQSGATQLLGFALRKNLNMSLSEYLSKRIWSVMGMESAAKWTTDDFGMEKAFCCIHAIPRDYAKIGQLFLDNGKANGIQIISSSFLEKMHSPTRLSYGAYGMGLWVNNDHPTPHYYFWGLYGQYIIIIPKYNMVVVRTGTYKDQPLDSKGRPMQVAKLVDEVVKTFQ